MKRIPINPYELYKGCLLAAIAHAVTVGEYPEFNYEHSWDGINYCMNNSQGCRATITFHSEFIIAVFQESSQIKNHKTAKDYFQDAPSQIVELAYQETLQYVLDDLDGEIQPVITAAFWGNWKDLYSLLTWDEIVTCGGYIIENQLLDYQKALAVWDNDYGFNNQQIDLICDLFQQKIKADQSPIVLNSDQIKSLYGDRDEYRESLQELNIIF